MPTVLFTWELGDGLGHMLPMLPLAEALVRRGHKVYVALRDLTRATAVFGHFDVKLLQAPFRHSRPGRFNHTPSFAHVLANIGFGDDGELHALVCAWRNLIGFVRPDLIVFDHSPTALLAARCFPSVRRVVTGLGFFCPPDVAPWPALVRQPVDMATLLAHEVGVLARVNRLLGRCRRPAIQRLGQLYGDADKTVLATFLELDHYPDRPAGACYVGPVHSPGGETPRWPGASGSGGCPRAGAGPRVYAYLKNSSHVAEVLAALAELGGPTIVFGDGIDAAVRRKFEATPSMRFETRRLDMKRVRTECDIAVHNANHGTLCQLLLGGRPMLQVPITLEQQVLARRVEELGAAETATTRGATAGEEIRRKLHAVATETRYAEAACRFARKYEYFDPAEQVERMVARVEELIETGRQGDRETRGQGARRAKVFAG